MGPNLELYQENIFREEDGFYWLVLEEKKAREVYESGLFSLYAITNDYSSLIESKEDFEQWIGWGEKIGMELGFLEKQFNLTKID